MAATTWNIDRSHSTVSFRIRHMVIARVNGTFEDWAGELKLNPENLADSTVNVNIKAASIDTHEADRDAHLKSADFFDVVTYPEITFTSTTVEPVDAENVRVAGDLTIHGVTRPVVLAAEFGGRVVDPWGNDRIGFTATTKIDRKEFGLT
ncbi:MAG: YceI family protein, partial [Coriobacteriia bacterium]|nr:YceI family protein [Coriobacteriia bacterium]